MKLTSALSLLALALVPAVSSATSAFTIDFNDGTDFDPVYNTYAAQGVGFTNLLFGINGASTYFSDTIINHGTGIAYATADVDTYVNVPAGIDYVLNFDFSSLADITVSAWSGLNGTGTFLGTTTLLANTLDTAEDHWTHTTFTFSAPAGSIVFSGANIATGAAFAIDNVSAVPEASSLALLAAALGVVGFAARRRQG